MKSKDPKIYQKDIKFFENTTEQDTKKEKKKKEKHLSLKDYERKLLLERNEFGDEENSSLENKQHKPTYVEEQQKIKEAFKEALVDENEDDTELLVKKDKSEEEIKKVC